MNQPRIKTGTTPGGRPYRAKKHAGEKASITVQSKQGNKTYMKKDGAKTAESKYGSKGITKGPRSKAK